MITGTVGPGKTSVAEAVDLLNVAEIPHAVIDLDGLCQSWPPSPEDRFNLGTQLRNLRCVARNYLDAGAVRLVLAGVVESRVDPQRYRETLGIELALDGATMSRAVTPDERGQRRLTESPSARGSALYIRDLPL